MPLFFNRVLEVLTRQNKSKEKEMKGIQITFSERRNKTNLTVDDMIVCV